MDRRAAMRLTGVLAGITTLPLTVGMIQSCQPSGTLDWEPSFFTKDEAKSIENLAEVILPTTEESLGAKEVHVAEFIDKIVRDCISPSDQEVIKSGITALNIQCNTQTGRTLDKESTQKTVSWIEQLDKESFSAKKGETHDVYRQLKQLVLLGFFTSEKVMRTALNYQPIPGKYVGCVPLSDDPRVTVGNNVAG